MIKIILKLTVILALSVSLVGCNHYNVKDKEHTKIAVNPPTEDSLNDYKDYSVPINNSINPDYHSTESSETTYIGNKNSKKFHKPDCYTIERIKEENRFISKSRQELIDEEFSPCKICNP